MIYPHPLDISSGESNTAVVLDVIRACTSPRLCVWEVAFFYVRIVPHTANFPLYCLRAGALCCIIKAGEIQTMSQSGPHCPCLLATNLALAIIISSMGNGECLSLKVS